MKAAPVTDPRAGPRAGRLLLWALAALVLARGVSLAFYPLMDMTESRYADIGRRMVETGDLVTPWFADGVPFWGKPPLSFWATALGFRLFGLNEMAARLPHLLLGVAVAALVWRHARQQSQRAAWHAVALLAGSTLFLVASGAVMTDMALAVGTTLVMVGIWRALHAPAGDWVASVPWVLGAVIGMLAKGPVSLILWGVPLLAWVLLTGRLRTAWARVPWLRGMAVVVALSLPWYLLAEARSPGFLHYFIVGEHWHRFVTPGWSGDLYGTAHKFPRGSIWPFALLGVMPWPLLLGVVWLRSRRARFSEASKHTSAEPSTSALARPSAPALTEHFNAPALGRPGEASYLWAWALTPCVFFSAAGNILWTYVLPGLPALAILAGSWTASRAPRAHAEGLLTAGLVLCTLALMVWAGSPTVAERMDEKSARALVRDYQARALPGEPLYFLGRVPFSGSFYSNGTARPIDALEALEPGGGDYVILSEKVYADAASSLGEHLTRVSARSGRVLVKVQ